MRMQRFDRIQKIYLDVCECVCVRVCFPCVPWRLYSERSFSLSQTNASKLNTRIICVFRREGVFLFATRNANAYIYCVDGNDGGNESNILCTTEYKLHTL